MRIVHDTRMYICIYRKIKSFTRVFEKKISKLERDKIIDDIFYDLQLFYFVT